MAELIQQRVASAVRLGFTRSPRSRYPAILSAPRRLQSTTAASAAAVPSYQTEETPAPPASSPQTSRISSLKTAKPFSSFLTDTFSRQHDYLRISVTERCNLRCLYCMPEEGVPLSPPSHLLTTPEIIYLSSLFVSQGVTKIRLTGGEPTVRKDIVPMMQSIGNLRRDGLQELCLTTNGISLHRKLDTMAEAGLTGVNLSLDTLDPFQFQIMTRRKGFDAVMRSIDRILEMNRLGAGIKLKINCVVMRGMNEREIIPFVEMGREKDIEVRFIEYMPFDGNKWSQGKMLPYEEMLSMIREKYPDLEKVQDHKNDTSKTYRVPGFEGKVGFITSMTHNFCGTCNRLRITGDGNLKVCLFGNAEVSLRDLIRRENDGNPVDDEAMEALNLLERGRKASHIGEEGVVVNEKERELLDVIELAVKRKKARHAGMGNLENMKNRPMILIGKDIKDISPSQFSPKRNSPTSRYPLPKSTSIVSPLTPWSTIPTHLLPSTLPSHIRFYSTNTKPPPPKKPQEEKEPTPAPKFTHLTPSQTVHMTPISHKPSTTRLATAICHITFSNPTPYSLLTTEEGYTKKGDVLAVARVAGIMAAKNTADLIPLAHPGIGVTGVEVDVSVCGPGSGSGAEEAGLDAADTPRPYGSVVVRSTVHCHGKTGVEMEALTSVMGAALTVYDMCKAVDKGMVVGGARVIKKRGGKSGGWDWGVHVDEKGGGEEGK
ncbi:hypothetical protein FQN54_001272 [Arachnomyces sp. PD_36]|nr:hypothetical protein FQN54_001272 [Arachnomyces sp. PD_36]